MDWLMLTMLQLIPNFADPSFLPIFKIRIIERIPQIDEKSLNVNSVDPKILLHPYTESEYTGGWTSLMDL